ncbi:12256_t:CDS:2 [Ambispora gerdemannii]|uniref:12256_t:CDS:1 n=1 Tax=Ambispora gerdemannii TaxID=144530 RepID=A0A9N9GMC0_9GLOM|nr:12256_t:CDS:2 [Ambispora gerdemannii]
MLTLLTISIIGLATIPHFINTEKANWKNMFPRDANISARSLTAALMPILFAYSGWNNLNYLCANIAYTNVPLSTITGYNEPSEIIAAFGALAANVLVGSRAIVAAAKRNYLPFSLQLKKWNEDIDPPIFALILRRSQPNLNRPFSVPTIIPKLFILFTLFVIIGSFVNGSSKIYTLQQLPNDDQCDSSKNHEYLGYKYYLPYVVSLVVIGVGAIFWPS